MSTPHDTAGGPRTPDAETIACVVRGLPGVAALDGGGLVQVATYLPGRRIDGVRVGEDRVMVSLTARLGVHLPGLAERVRAAVAPLAAGLPVDVRITDIEIPTPTGS